MFSQINISKVLASQVHSLYLNSLKLQGIKTNLCSLEKWENDPHQESENGLLGEKVELYT